MDSLKKRRTQQGISQRNLAKRAKISYKSLQLIESEQHNPTVTTLEEIARALGYPADSLTRRIHSLFDEPIDSIRIASVIIVDRGENVWKTALFNCVDGFRRNPDPAVIQTPPHPDTTGRIKALLASTVEALCDKQEIPVPWWCSAIPALKDPWFVAGIENLKPMALVESPVSFRKRNIFVLSNFLERR